MSEFDANVLVDGQKTVATIPLDGGIVKDGGEIDATCIVEDNNGKRHKAVKIVNVDDEPTIKSEINAQILNNNNELITVTEEQEGEIIPQSNSQIDFHCLVQKDEGEQLSVKTVELDGEIIKTGGAIDTTCIVQGSNGKKQLAVKVFKRGGGEIIETVSGNGSVDLPKAKANGLKSVKLFGGTEQSGTPTPTSPQDIISNNGVLKYSANICNVNEQTVLLGYYISAQGVVTADANNWIYQAFIPVKPNTTYTLSMSSAVYYVSISEYSTAEDSGFVVRKAGSTGTNTTLTITTGANTNFVRFGTNIDRTEVTLEEVLAINWMLNEGATAIPYAPYAQGGIYTDGTVETVAINLSDNLIDGQGTFVSPGQNTTRIYKAFGKLKSGTYHISISSGFKFIFQYKDTMEGTPTTYGNIGTWATEEEFEITDTSMFYGIAIRNEGGSGNIYPSTFYNANGKLLLYEANETATAEMLLSVGDYKDVQSVLDGAVTRNIGIKVFDGTETFINGQNGWITEDVQDQYWDNSNPYTPICSHFVGTSDTPASNSNTVRVYRTSTQTGRIYFGVNKTIYTSTDVFKQWLADQYAAGTPVIVVYPLETAITETVTPQTLQTQAGTNILQITQASIDNLPLEATYKRGK